jgi:hypothetical protein
MQYGSGFTGKKVESRSEHLVLATTGEGIWRTEGETIEPLGLPSVEHLVYPTLRNHGIDLMAEGFDILYSGLVRRYWRLG